MQPLINMKSLNKKSEFVYLGCRNSYVEKYFTQVQDWTTTIHELGEMQVGSITITPFSQQASEHRTTLRLYRLLVKSRLRKDG